MIKEENLFSSPSLENAEEVNELERALKGILDKYDWNIDMDNFDAFFRDISTAIERIGGEVLWSLSRIAPNGHLIFEWGGRRWVFDAFFLLLEECDGPNEEGEIND